MKYGVIGAGAMGVRYGVMLQETPELMLTSSILGNPTLKRSVSKAALPLPVITRIDASFQLTFTTLKNIKVIQMFGLSSKSKCS